MLGCGVGGHQRGRDPPDQPPQLWGLIWLPVGHQPVNACFARGCQPAGGLFAGRGERQAGPGLGVACLISARRVACPGTIRWAACSAHGDISGGHEFGQALFQSADAMPSRWARPASVMGALLVTRYINQVARGLSCTSAASARRR
jgi:hypothetical protein